MTDNLPKKLTDLIKEYTPVFEKGIPSHIFSQQTKNDYNIFCYHYQIPDFILYKEDNFDRKECFFITSNTRRQQRKLKKKHSLKLQQLHHLDKESQIDENTIHQGTNEEAKKEEISFKEVDVNDLFKAGDLSELHDNTYRGKNRYRKLSHQNIPSKRLKTSTEKMKEISSAFPINNYDLHYKNNNSENGNKIPLKGTHRKFTDEAGIKKDSKNHQLSKKSFKSNKIGNSKSLRTRKISVDELFENKENIQKEGNKNNQKLLKLNSNFNRKSSEIDRFETNYFSNQNEYEDLVSGQTDNNFQKKKRFKYFYPNRYFGRSSSLGYNNFKNHNWNLINFPNNRNSHSFRDNTLNDYNNKSNYFNKDSTKDGYFQNLKRDRKYSEIPITNNLKFGNYFFSNPIKEGIRNRLYSNNFDYFNLQEDKINKANLKLKNNKYDNIRFKLEDKAANGTNMNLFNLWDEINSVKTTKKKWFIRSQNQINYGPFSNEEIYNYLKTTLTTNPNSDLLKNSIIIDSEMDIYFKPDSALEVIQQEIKDITLPPNPKDELEKILIKVNKKEKEIEKPDKIEQETDSLQSNSKFVLEEKRPNIKFNEDESGSISSKHKPAEGEFVTSEDLYNFIYHHQKTLHPNKNINLAHSKSFNHRNLREIGVKNDFNDAYQKEIKGEVNIAEFLAKEDANINNNKMKKLVFPREENQIMRTFDKEIFQNTNIIQKTFPKRIKSFSFANSLNLDTNKFLNKTFNKFDLKNSSRKAKEFNEKSIIENQVGNSNSSEKENKRPNVITAIIKPVSIEEIFATDKKPSDLNLPNPDILKEIKDFLFDEKNEIKPHDKKEISENQNLKSLIDLGITPKIEFRKQSLDLSNNKQISSEKSEGQIKHFLGKKVDGSITRNLEKSKGTSLCNKFDIPLNKICFTRKFSHATTNASKSSASPNKHSEESPVNSPQPSPDLDYERRKDNLLADSNNKNENFKKRRIDTENKFSNNNKNDFINNNNNNKENIDKNAKKDKEEINNNATKEIKTNINDQRDEVPDICS